MPPAMLAQSPVFLATTPICVMREAEVDDRTCVASAVAMLSPSLYRKMKPSIQQRIAPAVAVMNSRNGSTTASRRFFGGVP